MHASLADIYLPTGWTKMLTPVFKEEFRNAKGEPEYHHRLEAISKIRLFPIPSVGRTVYFYTPAGQTQRIPIGYAIYQYD